MACADPDPATTDFNITMDSLNRYMSNNDLPSEMRQRLRDYFHRTKHLWVSKANRDVLLKMSPKLQGEVLLHVNSKWIDQVTLNWVTWWRLIGYRGGA